MELANNRSGVWLDFFQFLENAELLCSVGAYPRNLSPSGRFMAIRLPRFSDIKPMSLALLIWFSRRSVRPSPDLRLASQQAPYPHDLANVS